MSQALATSVSTGTSLALLWKVLDGASHSPALFCPARPWFELHWPSVVLGILVGLLLGPVLEALVSLRLLASQAVVRRVLAGLPGVVQRPLHRLV